MAPRRDPPALLPSALRAVLALAAATVAALPPWSVNSRGSIVDSLGRERLFRGVNVVYKAAPYAPRTEFPPGTSSLDDPFGFGPDDARFMRSVGFNVVRLNVMWAGVEPVRGRYNATYVAEMRKIIRMLDAEGVKTIVEFHQDCISEMFCGEGIPIWAAKDHEFLWSDRTRFPWPAAPAVELVANANFTGVYEGFKVPTYAACAALTGRKCNEAWAPSKTFQNLYTNGRGMRDKFAAYWRRLARALRGEPGVLGFELFNEPGQTDTVWSFPGLTDERFLAPFYDAIAPEIRAEDPERLILFEPTTWSDEYPNTTLASSLFASRLPHAPGGRASAPLSVLAFHYYSWMNKGRGPSGSAPVRRNYLDARARDAERLGVGRFVTEWMLWQCGDDGEMDDFDAARLSWTAWNYKPYSPDAFGLYDRAPRFARNRQGSDAGLYSRASLSGSGAGTIQWGLARCLARTYPRAVQGALRRFSFNDTSGAMSMEFDWVEQTPVAADGPAANVPAATIFVNTVPVHPSQPARYPDGVDVTIEPEGVLRWAMRPHDPQVLELWPATRPAAGAAPRAVAGVTVTVRAAGGGHENAQ
jgi:endoglycosylceramidase